MAGIFYFQNRGSNLKEGIIKNIRVVKDFLDDRGYAFIDAEMVETEPFSDKELLKMMSWSSNVRRFKLGDSEVVLAFESGGLSDFDMFSKDLSSSGKVSAYIMHDDELVWIAQESESRYFAREPFRTFLRLAEPLDAKLFHGYCKSHFAGSELVTQTSENYLSELKRYARNLTAKNIGSMTLQSWYFKQ